MPSEDEPPPGSPSLDGNTMEEGDGGRSDPWRHLSGRELRARTVVFRAEKDFKLLQYVECMGRHGINAQQILSVQVSTAGQCRITFTDRSVAENVSSHGFYLAGHLVRPSLVDQQTTNLQLHVHDVPIWISDAAVVAALAIYGTVRGPVRHGKVKVSEGVHVASGVRFATFTPNPGKAIPSYVRSRDGKGVFRVYHAGQQPTCRICEVAGHIARNCPQKANRPTQIADLPSNQQAGEGSNRNTNQIETLPGTNTDEHVSASCNSSSIEDDNSLRARSLLTSIITPLEAARNSSSGEEDSSPRTGSLLTSTTTPLESAQKHPPTTNQRSFDDGTSTEDDTGQPFIMYHSRRKQKTHQRSPGQLEISPTQCTAYSSPSAAAKKRRKRKIKNPSCCGDRFRSNRHTQG